MDKQTYYVNLRSREVSQVPYDNNANFVIEANKEEVRALRAKLDEMYHADNGSFLRAHVPFVPHHKDSSSASYDSGMKDTYQMLYELGGEKTKADITSMGVLGDQYQ